MPPRKKPTLLAQGKPRTLGGTSRPWRVRLYAGGSGSAMGSASGGSGYWRRYLGATLTGWW